MASRAKSSTTPTLLGRIPRSPLWHDVESILAEYWLPPHVMSAKVTAVLEHLEGLSFDRVLVSGESRNVTLYVVGTKSVLVANPFSSIRSNVLLREVFGSSISLPDRKWFTFPLSSDFLRRLSLPTILLVNPCVLENFPIPRLSLSIGLLASYLRKNQQADVRLIDMQLGDSLSDVVSAALSIKPDLIGVSVSYGQKALAESLLDELYAAQVQGQLRSTFVLGNVIPASFPKEFLDRYPGLLIAVGEGEATISALCHYLAGDMELSKIPGLAYKDACGCIQLSAISPVVMNTIPLPALDGIDKLAHSRGALTLELSRGCQWNVCTFCPREHKSHVWKTLDTPHIIEQFMQLREVADRFGIARHLFLADEEFIGGLNDNSESERMIALARGLLENKVGMQFDAAARVDQVFDPKEDLAWHLRRMEMWHLCAQAGLDRLFMGIESGSDSQLRRYGKGIKAEHSIIAIRILTALGIPVRFGFITFDQLMVGLAELKENIAFLERRDAFMVPVNVAEYGYERLFNLLTRDPDFIEAHSQNKPVAAGVSYMLATMEVLINSRYRLLLKSAERQFGKALIFDGDSPDTNMGRYRVGFLDDRIREISQSSQRWIDRHFAVAYAVKSLYKVASAPERARLLDWMVRYRQISLELIKALVYVFDQGAAPRNPSTAHSEGFLALTVLR
ncbi:MAG TPA: radical SAM protein, partial [Nitrospira sp.]|nr:radical SAM protein [Nitrospira sp.]